MDCWKVAEQVLAVSSELAPQILLWGPPGTGKSYAAQHCGKPAQYNLTLTDDTCAASLMGHWVPQGQQFVFHYGPWVRAMMEGKRIVVNEIQRAQGDAVGFFLAALDNRESCRITLYNNETIIPQPGYQVIATSNSDPKELEPALLDRFPIKIYIDTLHPNALATLPQPLQHAFQTTDGKLTFRGLTAFKLLTNVCPPETAALAIWGAEGIDLVNTWKLNSVEGPK